MTSQEWIPILVGTVLSGLVSLGIAHLYYGFAERKARRQHEAQVLQMVNQHGEQVLFLRTMLRALEKEFGIQLARDSAGNLTGGFHIQGKVVSTLQGVGAAIAGTIKPPA